MSSTRGPRVNGQAISYIRFASGLSQAELAEATGLDNSYISRIESGQRQRPTPGVARRIAGALKVPLAAILADPDGGVS